MIEYLVKKDNGEEMNGQAKLIIMSIIVNEDEEGYEGKTALITTNDGNITARVALLALAGLVASVVKNVTKDIAGDGEEVLDYIIDTAIDMIHN